MDRSDRRAALTALFVYALTGSIKSLERSTSTYRQRKRTIAGQMSAIAKE
jgi:hypothetical protein